MKILQVLPVLTAGGAEGFVTNLSVSLAKQGADVRVYLMAGVRGERGRVLLSRLQDAGVQVEGTEERNIRSPKNLFRLASLIHSWQPDIVQANLYAAEVACTWVKLLLIGGKAFYVHRLANTDFQAYRSPWVIKKLDRFFPLTIACSEAVGDAYRLFMNDQHRGQLVVIPNGGFLLDYVPAVKDKQIARKLLALPNDAFVVVHIGRMQSGGTTLKGGLQSGQKGYDTLINAFAQTFFRDQNAVLVLVGDGPLRSDAEALAQSLDIGKQVRFLGLQPEPWPALTAADVFCFPSRYEGLPNVLPEAASCGLPVVASDIPEIRSLYLGDAWLLRPVDDVEGFADALRTVRDNLGSFTDKAHQVAPLFRDRFSMKSCAEKYLHRYKSILG